MATKNISDDEVVRAYVKSRSTINFADEILTEETGEPIKVCLSAMRRAMNRGLIAYGFSLRSGWITNLGQRLIDNE